MCKYTIFDFPLVGEQLARAFKRFSIHELLI
jgi:hypothetical protein